MAQANGSSRPNVWLRVVLFASLALNLVVVGLIVGFVARGGPPARATTGTESVAPYTRAFTEEQRKTLRRDLRSAMSGERGKGGGRDLRTSYQQALVLLRADPFDSAAMASFLEQQTARGEARRRLGQAVLASKLEQLSVEERRSYADRLEVEITRIFERRRKGPKKD